MNLQKLAAAEAQFLTRYPGGFDDPAMAQVRKRHNIGKIEAYAKDALVRENFNRPTLIAEAMQTIVSRSSMVSRFEKPRFREFIHNLNSQEKQFLADALEARLYGRAKQRGFEIMLGMLESYKIAKWPLISVVPFYHNPTREAFVKPTTAKGIIQFLEVEDLNYRPTPSWDFYRGYRKLLDEVREQVSPTLGPNYAALSGFLMSVMSPR